MSALAWLFSSHRNERELISQDTGSVSYYWLLIFSSTLATLGILLDNPNVILGAMLVAPLLVPIYALSVAIAHGQFGHMLKALSHLSISTAVILVISALVALVIPTIGLTDAAIVRAQPTLIDLLIALTAGAAGMYAYLHKDIPESLAGVAVAVSLVTPLCAAGVGLATNEMLLTLGAVLMFFTNVVATISGGLLVLLITLRSTRSGEIKESVLVSWGVTFAMTALLATLLTGAFITTLKNNRLNEMVDQAIKLELADRPEIKLEKVKVTGGNKVVEATIHLPEGAEMPDADKMAQVLSSSLGRPVTIELSALRIEQSTGQAD